MADPDVRVDIEAKGAEKASAALKGVSESISGTGKAARRADPSVKQLEKTTSKAGNQAAQLSAEAKAAERSIRAMGRAATYANVRLKALERTQKRLNRATAKSGALGAASGLGGAGGGPKVPRVPKVPGVPRGGGKKPPRKGKGVQKIGSGGVAGGSIIALAAKFGSMAYLISAIIPALVTGIASLGAGILGLAGALAPLGGLLVAYPGYLAAVGQGFLAVKLSMAGIADGLKSMTDASMSWQDANKGLARFTGGGINKSIATPLLRDVSGLGIAFKNVGYLVQRTLVPGMRQALAVGRSMIPMVAVSLTQTGKALGGIMKQVAGYVGSARAQSLISGILGTNTGIIKAFGSAISGILSMVLEMVNAAGPMLTRMAQDLSEFINRVSGRAQGGGLAKFFDSAYEAAKKVLRVINPLIIGLWNIIKLGKPLGDAILGSWGKMAQKFQLFTESATGVQKITGWFEYMKPILYEVGNLVGAIASAIASLSMQSGFIEMSQVVRRDLLPIIQKFIMTTADQMLPLLIEVVKAVLNIIVAWQSASVTFVIIKTLTSYLSLLGAVLSDTGGIVSKFLTTLLALLFVMKVGTIAAKLWATVTGFIAPTLLSARIAMRAYSISMDGASVAAIRAAVGVKAFALAIKGALLSTVIGVVVVALGFLIEAMMAASNAKNDEIAKNKEWAASLYEVNGALSVVAAQTTAAALKDSGAFQMAATLGIPGSDVVKAAMNDFGALKRVRESYQNVVLKWNAKMDAQKTPQGRQEVYRQMGVDPQYIASKKLLEIIDPMAVAFVDEGKAAEAAAKGAGTWGKTLEQLQNPGKGAVTTVEAIKAGMDALTTATLKSVDAFQKLKGVLENSDWNIGFRNDLRALKKDLKGKKGLLFDTSSTGDRNRSAANAVLTKMTDRAQSFYSNNNKPQAAKTVKRGWSSFIDVLADSGFGGNRKKAQAYAEKNFAKEWAQVKRLKSSIPIENRLEGNLATKYGVAMGQVPQQALPAGTQKSPYVTATEAATNATLALSGKIETLNTILGASTPGSSPILRVVPKRVIPHGAIAADQHGKWAGGPVAAGWTGWVGELGPEAFVDRLGNMSIIGKNGPEIKAFSSSGNVIPNNELSAAVAAQVRTRSDYSEGLQSGGIHISIGDIHQASEFDVVQAVKRGMREAERDRRERG